jgi:hypothetical protein
MDLLSETQDDVLGKVRRHVRILVEIGRIAGVAEDLGDVESTAMQNICGRPASILWNSDDASRPGGQKFSYARFGARSRRTRSGPPEDQP